MTEDKPTLAQLTRERDRALAETRSCLSDARIRASSIDADVKAYAVRHPFLALGGAAVAGVGAGWILKAPPILRLARGSLLVILSPVIEDAVKRLVRLVVGEPASQTQGDATSNTAG